MGDGRARMATGIAGLDQLLGGGVIRGNSLLIEGPPGSGKSTLGLRMLCGGALQFGEPGLLITFEEFPRQVYAESLSCGLDLEALERAGLLRVIWTPPGRILESFRGKSDLVEQVIREIGVRRLLIDSITHFKRVASGEAELREIVSGILTQLKIAGVNTLLVKELERQDDATIAFEEYLADASLRLHNRRDGVHGENSRYIEIRKTRGQGHVSGLHPFRLDTEGIRIFPRLPLAEVQTQLPPSPPPSRERVAFGVEGLDAMLRGGLLPGTATVVSGYAGSGKSVLAHHFVDAGLRTGGSGMVLSLKGDGQAVLAAAASLGMAWDEAVASGRLRVLHFCPLGLAAEEILDRLVEEIRRGRPDRFVCDSLDCLARITKGDGELREHLLTLTGILRHVGATSLFLHGTRRISGECDDGLAWFVHLAACAVKFSQAEIEGRLRSFVGVVKHVGSDHVKELREVQIDGGRLHVARSAAGVSGILTGQAHRAVRQLSEEVLPALASVDRTLQRLAQGGATPRSLPDEVQEARRQIGSIDGHLREYFGGIDLTDHDAEPRAAASRPDVSILLVEDNPTNRAVALGILKLLNLQADAATDGAEAIRALWRRPYDLVLMDVAMPGMDGLEATRRIRASASRMRDVPIIAMTAHAMAGDRERCLEAGMNDHIAKPVSSASLAAVLAKWLPASEKRRTPSGAEEATRRLAALHGSAIRAE